MEFAVLGDINFPASSLARTGGAREIRADGLCNSTLLEAILQLMPLDTYEQNPVMVMEPTPEDKMRGIQTPNWKVYSKITQAIGGVSVQPFPLHRYAFYERAKKAYAIVSTGERAMYGCIILRKGVLTE